MKKILTIAVLFAALMTAVPAKAEVKFGLKGGLNLTSMSLDANAISKSNQAGFFIGPTVKFTLPIVGLGFDASALYDQRKADGIGLGSTASIYFFAGPQFGFNVGDKDIKTDVGNWTFKSSNISANVGLGLMLLGHLQVSANYNFGLGKTGELDILNTDFKENGKLNAWQIGLAYFF